MTELVRSLWNNQEGQDIAEYAVMLAVILVIVVGAPALKLPQNMPLSHLLSIRCTLMLTLML